MMTSTAEASPETSVRPPVDSRHGLSRKALGRIGLAVVALGGTAGAYFGLIKPSQDHAAEVKAQLSSSYTALEIDFGVTSRTQLPFVLHAHGLDNETAIPTSSKFARDGFIVINPGQTKIGLQDTITTNITAGNVNDVTREAVGSLETQKCDNSSQVITNRVEWDAELARVSSGLAFTQNCLGLLTHQGKPSP